MKVEAPLPARDNYSSANMVKSVLQVGNFAHQNISCAGDIRAFVLDRIIQFGSFIRFTDQDNLQAIASG